MREEGKKIILTLVLILIIILSIFIVITQQSLEKINKEIDEGVKPDLSAYIIVDKSTGTIPLKVNFKSFVSFNNGETKYFWDFGNGYTSNLQNPIYTYTESGTFICTLIVSDSNGKKITDRINISALKNNPPFVKIVVDKTSGNRPTTINFDSNCFDVDGEIISYHWEIIYPPFLSYQSVVTIDEKNFSKTFIRPGFYEIKLTVSDNTNNKVTEYLKIQIFNSRLEQLLSSGVGLLTTLNTLISIAKFIYNIINPSMTKI